jgi:hypothetical protein
MKPFLLHLSPSPVPRKATFRLLNKVDEEVAFK